jgi:PAS domain S-box-containing protein
MQTAGGEVVYWEFHNTLRTADVATPLVRGMAKNITERRRSERALAESEANMRAMSDNANVGMLVLLDGRYAFANRHAAQMLGYSVEELARLHIADIIHPDDRPMLLERHRRRLAGEAVPSRYEARALTKDGRTIPVELDAAITRWNGQTADMVFVSDISERKQMEAALRESEQRYRVLVEWSPEPVAVHRGGKLTYVNPAAVRMLAAGSAQDLAGKPILDIVHPDFHQIVLARMQALDAGAAVAPSAEVRFLKFDGTTIDVEIRSAALLFDGEPAFQVIGRDLTERKLAEAALRASEARFRSMFDNIQDVYFESTLDGTITEMSPNVRMLSRAAAGPEDYIGKPATGFYQDPARRDVFIAALKKHGSVTDFEIDTRSADGSLISCSLSAKLVFDENRRPVRVAGTIRDISERKRAEEALRLGEANLRAVAENATVGITIFQDDRRVFANRRAAEMLGYGVEDFLPLALADVIHPDSRNLVLERSLRRAAGGRVPAQYEFMALTKDGRAIPVEGNYAVIAWNGRPAVITFVVDIAERKRAEEALQRQEHLLSQSQRIARIGSWSVDLATRSISWTNETYRLYGVSPDTFVPSVESLLGLIHPDDRRAMQEWIGAAAAGEYGGSHEFRVVLPDGSTHVLQGQGEMTCDDGGRPAQLIGTVQDITERKVTENVLRLLSEDTARLRGAAFYNEVAGQVARFLEAEIGFVGKRVLSPDPRLSTLGFSIDGQFMPPVEYDPAGTPCAAVLDRGATIVPERVQQLFPSDRMLVELNAASYAAVPLFDSNGRTIGHVGVMGRAPLRRPGQAEAILRLFAVRIAAEMERMAVEQRFHDLFEYSPEASVIVDQAGRIALANREAGKLFGYSHEELIGLSVDELMPQADKHAHEQSRRQYFMKPVSRTMGAAQANLRARRKDGSTLPVDISLNPLHSDEGMLVVATVRDLTARVQAEERRKALEAQLRQSNKMEAIGTLAGGIAHDFNNIVSAIIGNIELAREDVGADHPARQSLDEIGKASRRARDLVKQILAFSRQQPEPRHAVALSPLVEEVVKLLRATLPAGVELVASLAADAPSVLADPTQIHQILMNLCTNAWHAMENDRGRIDIRLDSVVLGDEAGRIDAELSPGRYAHLSVKDSGKGMDTDTRERIFEPFFTTKAVGEGTGLGLSVVHGIMRGYAGAISVDSQPGRGATFHLYFPAVDAAAATAGAEQAPASSPRGRGQQVLYLDDDESLVILVQRTLERKGYRVAGYTDAAEALQALAADPRRFDLVVTDYSMPGMSGLDVAREVARIRPGLPVAVTSGYISDELREQAPQAGVRELIYKPDSAEDLCDTVGRLLDQAD